MEKQKKEIDASVILKWFSKEIDSDKALKLKESHLSKEFILITPEFLILEIMNALRYKEKDKNKVKEANKALQDIQLNTKLLTKELIDKAIENSYEYNITIYDSLYISLAQFNGCPLITADKELYKIPNVIPLENY